MAGVVSGPVDHHPLELVDLPVPEPTPNEILVRVTVCGVCRTDLHVVEGDLGPRRDRVVPGTRWWGWWRRRERTLLASHRVTRWASPG